jgi:hypothetical protein
MGMGETEHRLLKDKAPSARWQRLLWSAGVEDVDLERDKIYVIHQVLAWGEPEDLSLLFRIYAKEEVKRVFLEHPKRVYTRKALRFVELILDVEVDGGRYVSRVY